MREKIKKSFALIILIFLCCNSNSLKIIDYPIVTPERLKLTAEYAYQHYGINTFKLENPKIIVMHYTASDSLEGSLTVFKSDKIPERRAYIKQFSDLNVGIHFVISKQGEIFSLLPTDIIARHAIGLNYTSIGIELVSSNSANLTEAQLLASADLIKLIIKKHPSVEYLIGHHEYVKKELPHFKYYKELNENYKPTVKIDPGSEFMAKLRALLQKQYGIILKE